MTPEYERLVEVAARFFGKTIEGWTVQAADAFLDESIRAHVESATASLDHDISPARSWMQSSNGSMELLTTSVVGEFEAR